MRPLVTIVVCLVAGIHANNYDGYLAEITSRNMDLKRRYFDENSAVEDLLAGMYAPENGLLREMDSDGPEVDMTDSEWARILAELSRSSRQMGEDEKREDDEEKEEDWTGERTHIQERGVSPRRFEQPYENHLHGTHRIQGGSSEVGKWFDYALEGAGTQDEEEEAESSKEDKLPAYCEPPNPCPIGYDPHSLSSPCDADIEDTVAFNREWIQNKMESGECSCDTEHMKSCRNKHRPVVARKLSETPFLMGQKRSHLIKKAHAFAKRSGPGFQSVNPYFEGKRLSRVTKKNGW